MGFARKCEICAQIARRFRDLRAELRAELRARRDCIRKCKSTWRNRSCQIMLLAPSSDSSACPAYKTPQKPTCRKSNDTRPPFLAAFWMIFMDILYYLGRRSVHRTENGPQLPACWPQHRVAPRTSAHYENVRELKTATRVSAHSSCAQPRHPKSCPSR